tara:strand:- start:27 stop:926 length:900 start_codon:yes stop_codon:yes gene_type:complete
MWTQNDSPVRRTLLNFKLNNLVVCAFVGLLCGCANSPYTLLPSENFDSRVRHIVIHYTSENLQKSIEILTKPSSNSVSSHYLVEQSGGNGGLKDPIRTYRLVAERDRAWHAGRSYWHGQHDLNFSSIGIEIVNESGCDAPIESLANSETFYVSCRFEPFSDEQIRAVISLLQDILRRHPEIKPINIVGHSDIAPNRKVDPGPTFPWKTLYDSGIGTWYDEEDIAYFKSSFAKKGHPSVLEVQTKLANIGYKLELSGVQDLPSQFAVRAFQARYTPEHMDGFLDNETNAAIFAIEKKYRQ